jgi:hypothetical protein
MRWNQRPQAGESVFLRQVRALEARHAQSTVHVADDRRIPGEGGQSPQSLVRRILLVGGEKTVDLLELASLRLVRVDLVSTACKEAELVLVLNGSASQYSPQRAPMLPAFGVQPSSNPEGP